MAEYIKCEAAIARIKKYAADVYGVDLDSTEQYSEDVFADIFCNGLWSAIELIDDIPAADVAPVVRGRWVTHYRSGTPAGDGYVSTCCDMWNKRKSDYCPNCGAKMDGVE